jgi:hypothetical protein
VLDLVTSTAERLDIRGPVVAEVAATMMNHEEASRPAPFAGGSKEMLVSVEPVGSAPLHRESITDGAKKMAAMSAAGRKRAARKGK